MSGNSQKITRGQERAIAALLSSPSVPKAARAVKVTERTLYRWLTIEEFQAAYQEARREVVKHAVVAVQSAMSAAVSTLRSIMADDEAPASARVSAARAVIGAGLRSTENDDIECRLAAIEERINS
jgi:hypothetical protein